MAQFNQLGSPFSLVFTTPALTINDLVEASFDFDPELHEHFRGSSRFVRYTIGNDNTTITFQTSDKAAIAALIKGMEVGGVTLTFKGTYTGVEDTDPTVTQSDEQVSATISTMMVIEREPISNNADKSPAMFSFTLRACEKESDGSAPTIAFSYSAGGQS